MHTKNGIWNKETWLDIIDTGLGSWGFSVKETNVQTSQSVKTISMNKLIQNHNITQIDILKIDIESAEIELFQSNYETWLPITKVIIIELHDWMREGCSKQFFGTLSKYNFSLSHKGENLLCYIKP